MLFLQNFFKIILFFIVALVVLAPGAIIADKIVSAGRILLGFAVFVVYVAALMAAMGMGAVNF